MWKLALLLVALPVAILIRPTSATEISVVQQESYSQSVVKGDRLQAGRTFYQAGRFAEAAAAWQAAAQTYSDRGDRPNIGLSLSYLSLALMELAQWEAAAQTVEKSIEILEGTSEQKVDAILLAQAFNSKGSLLLARGNYQEAIETWERAETFYEQAGDETGVLGSRINRARALQRLGFYRRSQSLLQEAAKQLDSMPDSQMKASGLRSLGLALHVVGNSKGSEEILKQALKVAREIGATAEVSTTLLSLGNAALDRSASETALSYFLQAEAAAMHPQAKLSAQLNQLRLYGRLKQWSQAKALVPKIGSQLKSMPASRMAIESTVNFAESVLDMESHGQQIDWSDTNQLLAAAVRSAQTLQDDRAEAQALAKWGQLYAQNSQESEAMKLTEQSLKIAQDLQAADIIARSAWQLGRLQVKFGQQQEAIASYNQAVNALQSLRSDLVAINPEVQFTFKTRVEPVYRELMALLLPPIGQEKTQTVSQENLKRTRELIEALQLAELDNFFREACLDAQPVEIDRIDSQATAVYPIILSDRLAVIISSPGQPLRYYATPVSQTEVENTVKNMITHLSPLYDNADRLKISQQVYNWLILPAAADGALAGADTLVFVLDGILRNLPMAALHDGSQYLIERYNVALSPGLQLIETQALSTEAKLSLMMGGVSERRQGFSDLPAVEVELAQIAQQFPAEVLLNSDFTRDSVVDQFNKNPSPVVHLATHGQFSSNADETFLLTWDGRLNVQELDELLQRREIAEVGAIELLVLSACETAAGDDRAVLGLAGMAVKSGARSTLATLWRVRDQSTALFMSEFYKQLQQPGVTKAEAVRRAQLTLLANSHYSEPFFWAPFVLVGNWL
ncbi:MAG: CHAT domain-containing protein [Hormoscilla sp.]